MNLGTLQNRALFSAHPYQRDEPALFCLLHFALPCAPQVLHKLSECEPLGGVHVDVVPVSDELIVHVLG
jgi:hypothetical protein